MCWGLPGEGLAREVHGCGGLWASRAWGSTGLDSVGETVDYWGIEPGLGNWVGLVLGLELLGNSPMDQDRPK